MAALAGRRAPCKQCKCCRGSGWERTLTLRHWDPDGDLGLSLQATDPPEACALHPNAINLRSICAASADGPEIKARQAPSLDKPQPPLTVPSAPLHPPCLLVQPVTCLGTLPSLFLPAKSALTDLMYVAPKLSLPHISQWPLHCAQGGFRDFPPTSPLFNPISKLSCGEEGMLRVAKMKSKVGPERGLKGLELCM